MAARLQCLKVNCNDPHQIINDLVRVGVVNLPNGFQYHGSTLTFEYLPNDDITFRLEAADSRNIDPVITNHEGIAKSKTDFFIMLSVAMKFTHWGEVKVNREPGRKDHF